MEEILFYTKYRNIPPQSSLNDVNDALSDRWAPGVKPALDIKAAIIATASTNCSTCCRIATAITPPTNRSR